MPALFILIVYFAIVLLCGTGLAYPIHALLSNWFELEFDRVASRSVLLLAILLFIPLFKILKFKTWQELGYSTNKKQFFGDLIKGIGFGILIMSPVVMGLLLTNNRIIDTDWEITLSNIAGLFIASLAAGLIIGLIEETLFRGAMLTAIEKYGSAIFAITITSFIYALVHFLEPTITFESSSLHWGSGFALLKNSLSPLMQVGVLIDSFLALFLAGVLLALVKLRNNRIALCIGIHAGWVMVIKIFKRITDTNVQSEFAFLTGSYDKVIGYLAAVCIVLFIILFLKIQNK